jgi:hypothetical protein
VAECFDAKTGKKLWQKRLTATGGQSGVWSSAVLAGDRIYVANQSGDVFVLRAGPAFELLATNSVGEPTNASLAASDGELFLRTDKGLWCFGQGGKTGIGQHEYRQRHQSDRGVVRRLPARRGRAAIYGESDRPDSGGGHRGR